MRRRAAAGLIEKSCRCGATRLKINVPAPSAGTRVRCYCADCQTAARLHDAGQDMLTPAGGTDIWHTTPDLITIDAGAETLEISRLSPRGAFRWYAGCCGSLMFSTTRHLKLPFISVAFRQPELTGVDALLGPVRCHAFTASARPHSTSPRADKGMPRVGLLALKRALLVWMSGRARINPLRRSDGRPIAPVTVISLDARKAARPDHL